MKFPIKDFFSKCDQIHSFLWIWSHLLEKSLMENLIFCAVWITVFHWGEAVLPAQDSKHLSKESNWKRF